MAEPSGIVEVLAARVAWVELQAAKSAAWRAGHVLNMPTPRIKWFASARLAKGTPIEVKGAALASYGFVRPKEPNTIYLRVGQSVPELLDTVAHECAHVSELRSSSLKRFSRSGEPLAADFARHFTRALRHGVL